MLVWMSSMKWVGHPGQGFLKAVKVQGWVFSTQTKWSRSRELNRAGRRETSKMEERPTDQNIKTCSNKIADQPWVWLRGPVRHRMTVHWACSVDILGLRQSEFSGGGAGARGRAWEGREQVQVAIRE